MANLQLHNDSTIESPRSAAMATSTSVGDLNTSEEDATTNAGGSRKPILKKDSKYGSRRELPALGVSGVVSKGRPSIFEFWENMAGTTATPGDESEDQQRHLETADLNRSSLRRVLPPLPPQPASLTVTTHSNGGTGELGSRGEVEGSSNQPSPTCCVTSEMDDATGYWTGDHHDLLIDDLNRTKKQLAELQNTVIKSFRFLEFFDSFFKIKFDRVNGQVASE